MIYRCPFCGYELDYCKTIVVNESDRKFYNMYLCENECCGAKHSFLTDCTGRVELGHAYCCYPEELMIPEN